MGLAGLSVTASSEPDPNLVNLPSYSLLAQDFSSVNQDLCLTVDLGSPIGQILHELEFLVIFSVWAATVRSRPAQLVGVFRAHSHYGVFSNQITLRGARGSIDPHVLASGVAADRVA